MFLNSILPQRKKQKRGSCGESNCIKTNNSTGHSHAPVNSNDGPRTPSNTHNSYGDYSNNGVGSNPAETNGGAYNTHPENHNGGGQYYVATNGSAYNTQSENHNGGDQHFSEANGGFYNNPHSVNQNGGGHNPLETTGGAHNPESEKQNGGNYNPTETNGGTHNPQSENHYGSGHNPTETNGGAHNPQPENHYGSGHNPTETNGGAHNPQSEKQNGGNYNPTETNGGAHNPQPENHYDSGHNPTETNIGAHNPQSEKQNGVNYNLPTKDNHGDGFNHTTENNNVNSKDCECVPFYLCDDNNTVVEDGVGLLDIRIQNECDAYDLKCCKAAYVKNPDKPIIPTEAPSGLPLRKCGIRNVSGVKVRITGAEDNEAQYGEFPWMVAIIQSDNVGSHGEPTKVYRYQCGGSIIHPQVVLTAAHCVKGKNDLTVRAGEWDTQTKNEFYPTQDMKVQEVVVHEQFNKNSLANDAALLILESPLDLTFENVGLICLPEENENMDGRECVASGWGKDQFGKEGKYQVILKKVDLPIVPRDQCLEDLRKTRLSEYFKLDPSFICAGGRRGKDTCKGDGGSPLACPSKGNSEVYVQAGIVAWGIDCNTKVPGVYVNVPLFVTWIHNNLQQRGISL